MKKKLILGLATALLLASCGGAASSDSGNSSAISDSKQDTSAVSNSGKDSGAHDSGAYDSGEGDESKPEGSSQQQSDWTDEQKAMMVENLHGLILPFFSMNGLTFGSEDGAFWMEGARLGEGRLALIAALFNEADGWTEVTELYGVEPGTGYVFEKMVITEEGNRYIRVMLYGWDDENKELDEYGVFNLEAFDPYLYAFPSEFAASVASYFGSESVIPTIDADHYEVNIDPISLIAYMDSTEDDGGYSAALTLAGWAVAEEKDEDGYYMANSPDGAYHIYYLYEAEIGGLAVYFEADASYPEAIIDEFLALSDVYEGFEFPDFEFDGASYQYSVDEDFYGMYMVIYAYDVAGTDFELYLATLEGLGYDVEFNAANGNYVASTIIEDEGVFEIYLSYSEDLGAMAVKIYLDLEDLPITEWPSEDIADIVTTIAGNTTTVIPALDGADEYECGYDLYYGIGYIYAYGDAGLEETYEGILELAGWEYDGEQYISPNQDLAIQINYSASYGDLDIYILPYTAPVAEWPADKVAEAIGEKAVDTLPAYEGENEGFTFLDDSYGTAVVVKVAADTEEAAMASYKAQLESEDYTANEQGIYTSPNGNIQVYVSSETAGTITIAFMGDPWLDALSEFPLDNVNAFLTEYSLGFQLASALEDSEEGVGFLFENDYYYDYYGNYGYNYCSVTVKGNVVDAWNAALETTLITAGYELNTNYSNNVTFVYNNEAGAEVDIVYNAKTNSTYIAFYEA